MTEITTEKKLFYYVYLLLGGDFLAVTTTQLQFAVLLCYGKVGGDLFVIGDAHRVGALHETFDRVGCFYLAFVHHFVVFDNAY